MLDDTRKAPDREFRTAQEIVVKRLRTRILNGELRPGDRLLQADLAREMRTSTTPVREALWQLAGAGMLDVDPHHGVIVHIPTLAEVVDVYDLRLLLEPLAVAAAVDHLTEEDLQRAEQLTRAMEEDPDARAVVIHNAEFHEILVRASGRPRLTEILIRLNNLAMMYVVSNLYRMPGRVQTSVDEHRGLIAALRARDTELAQRLIAAHLQGSLALSRQAFAQMAEGARAQRR